jgi:hypothetical protein
MMLYFGIQPSPRFSYRDPQRKHPQLARGMVGGLNERERHGAIQYERV